MIVNHISIALFVQHFTDPTARPVPIISLHLCWWNNS